MNTVNREVWKMPPNDLAPLLEYSEELFAPETATHRWIRAQIEERGFPAIQISPLEGRILSVLASLAGAERLLELGTLGGYSALWLVSLLPAKARLITVEAEPGHAALAREAFERDGETRIEILEGDARHVIEARILGHRDKAGSFDLIFIDADKGNYPYYLDAACKLLKPGGLLLGDNAYWEGKVVDASARDVETEAIRLFNRRLAEDPRFESVLLPVRDGLAVARFNGPRRRSSRLQ
ncbi:MAG: O-methyltransferase [Gemmatimonadales bacterium]|jgi:predicted O-methyltransferase YrrM